jgi:RimJ/RimL family protein N-acetyltransferase
MFSPNAIISTPRGNVIIRPARLEDAIQFSGLRTEALRDNPTVFGSSYESCDLAWALQVLKSNIQDGCNFIAESSTELLGMAGIRRNQRLKTRHSATIGGVYIRPDWRGQGIIDGLIEACLDWAKKQQVVIIKLAVVTSNQAATRAYQRLGFTIYGTEPKVIFYEGVYYDEFLMSTDISWDPANMSN